LDQAHVGIRWPLRAKWTLSAHKDEAGRRITDPFAGPLFFDAHTEDDQAAGTIYVLRSKSEHPVIVANRDLVHKIWTSVPVRATNLQITSTSAMAVLSPSHGQFSIPGPGTTFEGD
jgi:hypothetical protein